MDSMGTGGLMQYLTDNDVCRDDNGQVYEVNSLQVTPNLENSQFFDLLGNELDIVSVIEYDRPTIHMWTFHKDPVWELDN